MFMHILIISVVVTCTLAENKQHHATSYSSVTNYVLSHGHATDLQNPKTYHNNAVTHQEVSSEYHPHIEESKEVKGSDHYMPNHSYETTEHPEIRTKDEYVTENHHNDNSEDYDLNHISAMTNTHYDPIKYVEEHKDEGYASKVPENTKYESPDHYMPIHSYETTEQPELLTKDEYAPENYHNHNSEDYNLNHFGAMTNKHYDPIKYDVEEEHKDDGYDNEKPADTKYESPKYEFMYAVKDEHTMDIHSQHEILNGDEVKGMYSLLQPDGKIRVVEYVADKYNGFNAHVTYKYVGNSEESKY